MDSPERYLTGLDCAFWLDFVIVMAKWRNGFAQPSAMVFSQVGLKLDCWTKTGERWDWAGLVQTGTLLRTLLCLFRNRSGTRYDVTQGEILKALQDKEGPTKYTDIAKELSTGKDDGQPCPD